MINIIENIFSTIKKAKQTCTNSNGYFEAKIGFDYWYFGFLIYNNLNNH